MNPPASMSGYQNPGWPGCCRPPNSDEQCNIPAADRHAVSIVHSISMLPDIKSFMDGLSMRNRPGSTGSGRGRSTPLVNLKSSTNRRRMSLNLELVSFSDLVLTDEHNGTHSLCHLILAKDQYLGQHGASNTGDSTDDGYLAGVSDNLEDFEAERKIRTEKAARLAQKQAEEREFKAARKQLAFRDFSPPKSWNMGISSFQGSLTDVHDTQGAIIPSPVVGSGSSSATQPVSSLPSPFSHFGTMNKMPKPLGSGEDDLVCNHTSLGNAQLANFDTSLSPWINATEWLVYNMDAVTTILRGIVDRGSSLLSDLMEIVIYKVRGNLCTNTYRLILSFSPSAPDCVCLFCLDTGSETSPPCPQELLQAIDRLQTKIKILECLGCLNRSRKSHDCKELPL
jgi:hypothetical protein